MANTVITLGNFHFFIIPVGNFEKIKNKKTYRF